MNIHEVVFNVENFKRSKIQVIGDNFLDGKMEIKIRANCDVVEVENYPIDVSFNSN